MNKIRFQIKVVAVFFSFFIFLFASAGCQRQIQSYDPIKLNPPPIIYQNETFKFKITLPLSWSEVSIKNKQSVVNDEFISAVVFDLPKQPNILTIYVFPTKSWQKQSQQKNNDFFIIKERPHSIFAYQKKDGPDKTAEEKEIIKIISSFKFIY